MSDTSDSLVKELKDIFTRTYKTFGPTVGGAVRVNVVPDGGIANLIQSELEPITNLYLNWTLKFAPDVIRDMLLKKYRATGTTFPYKEINERTNLSKEDQGIIRGSFIGGLIKDLTQDSPLISAGYYSQITKTISVVKSSVNAGTLAHEMAHAYTHEQWTQCIFMMGMRGMKNAGKLNEGVTVLLEAEIRDIWHKRHPDGIIPTLSYDSSYLDLANSFVKAISRKAALEAYFGGFITPGKGQKPEDEITVGTQGRKWKWPWR